MFKLIAVLILGYLLGCISPSAILSFLKKQNFRTQGTGNLGATNTMVILGKKYGALVMLFDMMKAFIAVKLAKLVFFENPVVWLMTGSMAVVGHVFPVFLKFKGGKGLASFGGMVLGYDLISFLILLAITVVLMFVFDYGTAMPVSAAVLFPFFAFFRGGGISAFLVAGQVGALIIVKHWSNLKKAFDGTDTRVREYIEKYIK